ncbi:unnamed protein product [Oikopleura dioica]|uniref:RING-type domain-containing protein n=1 Tax=Oikopleura dioica TaxID=34765 RepID=E4XZW1_OIKDI|nr:unnamed protein product [Oikopleura dioica]
MEDEKKAEKEYKERANEAQKAKDVFEKAHQIRNETQEKVRLASLAVAQEFQAQEKPVQQRTECNICFEEFNSEERKESVLHCGHRSCYKCLAELPNKLCPICRKEFTTEQIIKFF